MTPREVLVATAVELAKLNADRLDDLKARAADLERQDFVWYAILGAFSTWGSSRGWVGLMKTPANFERVTFRALEPLSVERRIQQADEAFHDAKMRMPTKKARLLASNFDRIVTMGGLGAARQALLDAPGRTGKLRFLKQFDGIGKKYARNIMMDVHHEDFRDTIAIDTRILNVCAAVGESFSNYDEHEQYLVDVAHEAGLTGWELDRLLYGNTDAFLHALRSGRAPAAVDRSWAVAARDQLVAGVERIEAGDAEGAMELIGEAIDALAGFASDA